MQLSPFLRCFPYHRSPFQGTHGDRIAGDNTRSRHNFRHFSYYATSPAWQLRNKTPRILVQSSSPTLDLLAAIAARVPSSKLHNTFISTLRISFRFGRNRKTLSLRACVAISWKRNDKLFLRPCLTKLGAQ